MDPVLIVLAYSVVASVAAALGILPLIGRDHLPLALLGWSNAGAAGTMLAAFYALADAGIEAAPLILGSGALAGIGFIWWAHAFSGTEEHDLHLLEGSGACYGYEVLIDNALHSAAEGVAIGAAMAVDVAFGIFVTIAIALHNIPEATLVSAVLRARGTGLGRAAMMAVLVTATQVPFAISTFAVLQAAPTLLPLALGFASGSLIYLVMVDLLPESYRQAGSTSVAMAAIIAMTMAALLQEVLP